MMACSVHKVQAGDKMNPFPEPTSQTFQELYVGSAGLSPDLKALSTTCIIAAEISDGEGVPGGWCGIPKNLLRRTLKKY